MVNDKKLVVFFTWENINVDHKIYFMNHSLEPQYIVVVFPYEEKSKNT